MPARSSRSASPRVGAARRRARRRAAAPNEALVYDLGRARDLDAERPTLADLQRARAHALRGGDRRRAAAYGLVIARRIEIAQADARADASEPARRRP
jgi:hypothetical protein